MANRNYCYIYLTCANTVEAAEIANTLLEKHLVICVKQLPVDSKYWWEGKIEHNSEVLLMMESALDLFDKVEKEVAKLHSYDTFVLETVEIAKVSQKAQTWLKENL
jgi:periplasmic divalent cation tolerance protein